MIAVTGANNALGDKVRNLLSGQGQAVVIVDRIDDAANVLRGCETVYHCLEHFNVANRSAEFYLTNVEATEKLMHAAAEAGVRRVLVVSSIAAAGPALSKKLRTEADEADPLPAPYQETKHLGEKAALRVAKETGVEVVIVRPSFIVGKGTHFTALCFAAYANSALRLIPDSRNHIYNFIGLEDAAKGCILAMERGNPGEIYYLTGDEHLTIQDTLALFSKLSGLPPARNITVPLPLVLISIHAQSYFPGKKNEIITSEFIENYVTWNWVFSNMKAKKGLGFYPKPIDRSWREAILWSAEQGFLCPSATDTVKKFSK